MTAVQNGKHDALNSLLDSAEDEAPRGEELADDELHQRLQEEHEARLKAESLSQDQVQRLAVHSEQVAEYAEQKARDLEQLKQQAADIDALTASAPSELASGLKRLFSFLGDASADAASFAAQAREDAQRHKRAIDAESAGDSAGVATGAEGKEGVSGTPVDAGRASSEQADGAAPMEEGDAAADEAPSVMSTDGMDDAAQTPTPPPPPPPTADDAPHDGAAATAADTPAATDASTCMSTGGIAVAEVREAPIATSSSADVSKFAERAKFIPMRLTLKERRLFRLLEAALSVNEYTDKVDILSWRNKSQRVVQQIKDICSILSGLAIAQDYRAGQALVKNRNFKHNEAFFQDVFEIGRRYKIMNPDRMRATYGKLLYMLMDSSEAQIEDLLDFKCIKPLSTVYQFLLEREAEQLLDDPLMAVATAEIHAADRPRHLVQQDLKKKENARKMLAKRYVSSKCTADEILDAVYSFSDNNTYLLFNRDPVERMIEYLKEFFDPRDPGDYSLGITSGKGGARLSHNHERQYAYVLQSLSLWSEISTDMFRLWYLAEADLLYGGGKYRLTDTGQGLNRVQAAPRVAKAMHQILARCQQRVGSWVGSSVVHLGDNNVPNALMFIDKYTQVPRILNPVVQVLDDIPRLAARDAKVAEYITHAFGSVERCRKLICLDFFRHAFDGSGADNFFDAGSCIDGRLTSAWNWCAKLDKKPYYTVFKMAGFSGFDGDFR